jgi:hypothetical protein
MDDSNVNLGTVAGALRRNSKVSPDVTMSRRWELKETVRCAFCQGFKCKRCGATAYLLCTNPAFEKFHANWMTNEILAMQRPSDELFTEIDLITKFKDAGITAIINLTEPGEHPFCGYGIKQSGFPYTPEHLMAQGSK